MKKKVPKHVTYVFWHNVYKGVWRAAKREHYAELFNLDSSKNVIEHESLETLTAMIDAGDK